ncbi:hypothetical protein V8C42DRAFT_195717 [Trichoderma barbatum]
MMPRCIFVHTGMQKQQAAACHRLLSAFFFPLLSSHPGSLAVDLVFVSCSTGTGISHRRGWSNVRTSTCIHGNSAPYSRHTRRIHDLTMLLRHHGIGRSNAKALDRRRQDGVNIPSLYPTLLLITLGVSPIPGRSVLVLRQVK